MLEGQRCRRQTSQQEQLEKQLRSVCKRRWQQSRNRKRATWQASTELIRPSSVHRPRGQRQNRRRHSDTPAPAHSQSSASMTTTAKHPPPAWQWQTQQPRASTYSCSSTHHPRGTNKPTTLSLMDLIAVLPHLYGSRCGTITRYIQLTRPVALHTKKCRGFPNVVLAV